MTKIVVFDAQGPVYLMVNKDGKIIPINETKQLKKDTYPSFYNDFDDYFALEEKRQMIVEEELVLGENISVVGNPGIVEFFGKLRKKGIKPVIITFGTTKATKRELEIVAEKYNKENNTNIKQNDIISMKDVYSVSDLGLTKANPEHWKKIIKDNYEDAKVIAVFEDTPKWLKNAMSAFSCKGFLVKDKGECIEKEDKETGIKCYEGNLKEISDKFFEII